MKFVLFYTLTITALQVVKVINGWKVENTRVKFTPFGIRNKHLLELIRLVQLVGKRM